MMYHPSQEEQTVMDLDLAIERVLSDMEPSFPGLSKPAIGGGPTISPLQGTLMWWQQLPDCEAKTELLDALKKHLARRKQQVDAIASGQFVPLTERL